MVLRLICLRCRCGGDPGNNGRAVALGRREWLRQEVHLRRRRLMLRQLLVLLEEMTVQGLLMNQ